MRNCGGGFTCVSSFHSKIAQSVYTFKPNEYTTVGKRAFLPPFVLIVLYLLATMFFFMIEGFAKFKITVSGQRKISKTPSIFL